MASPLTAPDTHPTHDFTSTIQLGLKAFNLAGLYPAVLGPRLPAGTVVGLGTDLDAMGVVVPGAKQAHDEAKTATAAQEQAVRKGYARIRAVRKAVRTAGAPKDVQKAYGVGQVIKPNLVRDVKAALKQILERAAANPAEAAGLGIIQKDLDAMTTAHNTISGADKAQEQKRASAPLTTKERNRTANRILKAVGRISAAGCLEFADDAEKLASFEALKPGTKSKKEAAKGGAPPGGVVPPAPLPPPPGE